MSGKLTTSRPTPEEVAAFRASGAFDEAWYVREYPDVAKSGMNPAEHYLWLGQRIGRHPTIRQQNRAEGIGLSWCIVATPHVLFIAHILAEGLRRHGWSVEIALSMPAHFPHDYYIILCAQMFEHLPPGEKRIIYQLEQSASSRWFSDSYIHDMANSLAVLDYSLQNIAFLESKGLAYPHVYYLPIGASSSYGDAAVDEKDIDVLFYGDYKSSPRRQRLLEVAATRHKIMRADAVFGNSIKQLIGRSKLVLNLHYYEGAQLETPRILECLSLGVPVVSESTSDQGDYECLDGAVTFFEAGDANAMLAAIAAAQATDGQLMVKVEEAVDFWQRRQLFMLDRFLMGAGIIPVDALGKMPPLPIAEGSTIALSLPETTKRRQAFNNETRTSAMTVFDGIRRKPGWIGCGMSYKYLCKSALSSGLSQLAIVEDDALLGSSHQSKMQIVDEFLDKNKGQWDVFSGLIAHLHEDVEVLSFENYKGIDFVTINRMTSMVFNIYSEKVLRLIAGWDQRDFNVETNAIDRFLENCGLKVVVATPFIVGHREELTSTLWGFQNSQYNSMIEESEYYLKELKEKWIRLHARDQIDVFDHY